MGGSGRRKQKLIKGGFMKRLILMSILLVLVSACGGGGGAGNETGTPNVNAPFNVTTSPANGDTGIEPGISVTVIFGEDMDESTISSSTFTLSSSSGTVNGTVSYDSSTRTATLVPSSKLASLTNYTAVLLIGIKSLSGNELETDYSWSFTTRDRMWGEAVVIDGEDVAAGFADIAINDKGCAIAGWFQYDISEQSIWANIYTPGQGWAAAELVQSSAELLSYLSPKVGIDINGNAITVWLQSTGSIYNVWANVYKAGEGWGTAEMIEDDIEAYTYDVSMSADGHAVAVWEKSDDIYASHYVPDEGWTTPQIIDNHPYSASYPQVAMDEKGNAMAVWKQSDLSYPRIWANYYTAGDEWGTAEAIVSVDDGSDMPHVAMNRNGDAAAVWHQENYIRSGNLKGLWANHYRPGEGWGTAQFLSEDENNVKFPQVALDGKGNAVAVWHEFNGTVDNIWANHYRTGSNWFIAELLEMDDAGNAQNPQIAADANGNFIVVWPQSDGTLTNIWTKHYSVDHGWDSSMMLELDDTGNGYFPKISMNSGGDAAAVWTQADGRTYSNVMVKIYE